MNPDGPNAASQQLIDVQACHALHTKKLQTQARLEYLESLEYVLCQTVAP